MSEPRVKRVLICEDSRSYAEALRRLLEHDGDIKVVAVCGSGEAAIESLARLRPDVLLMDVELPGMSGLEAVEEIMSARPLPILVLSSHTANGSSVRSAALAAGALEVLPKSYVDLTALRGPAAAAFRKRVKMLSGVPVIRHPRARLRRTPAPPAPLVVRDATVVGICASTGGPQALSAVLRTLPQSYAIPVLVVQHIAAGFTHGLVRWLDAAAKVPVRMATNGAVATGGIWVAPEGAHLQLGPDSRLVLDGAAAPGPHRPSADVLLTSIAKRAGRSGVAVVLTGMGTDGASGLGAVRRAGGLTIAQDEESSAVFGMPKAAVENGAELVLPLAAIGAELAALRPAREDA